MCTEPDETTVGAGWVTDKMATEGLLRLLTPSCHQLRTFQGWNRDLVPPHKSGIPGLPFQRK